MKSKFKSAIKSRSDIPKRAQVSLTVGPSWATTHGTMASSRSSRSAELGRLILAGSFGPAHLGRLILAGSFGPAHLYPLIWRGHLGRAHRCRRAGPAL